MAAYVSITDKIWIKKRSAYINAHQYKQGWQWTKENVILIPRYSSWCTVHQLIKILKNAEIVYDGYCYHGETFILDLENMTSWLDN